MTVLTHTLPNGFRIVGEHMPALESASVGIWVSAGGRHETSAQTGIAHFLEHMAFKGTQKRSALQIAEEIEDVGGYLNAYTSREVTAYYARVLRADVGLALDVIADILRNPVFDPSEIEVERGVILQEIGQALDTPDDVIFDWLQEVAYPDQPLGRPILGPAERVKGFSRTDLTDFVGAHYRPDRMILAAAGAIDFDALVRDAEALFGDAPGAATPAFDAARWGGGEHRQVHGLEQVHMALAFDGPCYTDPKIYAAQIYASILGGGMSSRLFQEAREKRGLCYTIHSHTGAYSDTGMMTIYAGTSAEQIGELTDLTVDEIKRAATDISETEVARARTQMKAGLLMGLESPSGRSERLARLLQIWDRVPTIPETVDLIDAVTREDVRGFAEDMVARAGNALALYGPVEAAPSLDAIRRRLAA